MSSFKTPIASRHLKKYSSKWDGNVFSNNGIRIWLFVGLVLVADREILIAALEITTGRNK